MSDQPQYDVFLAHSSQDKPQVRAVAKELRQRGLNPWLDEDVIAPGRWFQDVIQQAIPDVKSAAIFIGPGGLGKWQVIELRTFISQCVEADIPVIPVLLPGIDKLPTHLLFLSQLNWVRFTSGIDDVEALAKLEWGITGRKPELTSQVNLQVSPPSAVKINRNQELRDNCTNSSTVKKTIFPTFNSVSKFRINPHNQRNGAKSQWPNNAKLFAALGTFLTSFAIIIPVISQNVRCWTRIAPPDKCIPRAVIVVEGSTSMININNALAKGLSKKIPNTVIKTNTISSDQAIKDVIDNKNNIAAVSRELKDSEKASGLLAEYVAENKIAVVVGKDNPVWRLTLLQVKKIFQGEIKNWSDVKVGYSKNIKVINRPPESGTHQEF